MTPQQDLPIAPLPALPAPQRWNRRPAVVIALVFGGLGFVSLIGIVGGIFWTRYNVASFYVVSESMLPTLKIGDRFLTDKHRFIDSELPEHGDVVVFFAPARATLEKKDDITFVMRVAALPGDTIQVKGARIIIEDEVFSEAEGREPHEYIRASLELGADTPIQIATDHIEIDKSTVLTPQELAKKLGRSGAKIQLQPGQVLVNGNPEVAGFKTQEDPGYDFPGETGSFLVDSPERDGSYKVPAGHLFVLGDNRNRSADSHIWGPLDVNRLQGRVILTAASRARDQY